MYGECVISWKWMWIRCNFLIMAGEMLMTRSGTDAHIHPLWMIMCVMQMLVSEGIGTLR
jgi:hypothetical protein